MQLIDWLAYSGARDATGAPVSSGLLWAYQPGGGTATATVYTDVNGTVAATQPVVLDAAGRAKVYTATPVRIVIQGSMGTSISDYDQANVAVAEAVSVTNSGWSDAYLDGVLSKLFASTGGQDGLYQESSGATVRTIHDKFAEAFISVKDFGAKGDGLTVDTTAIQAAINRVGFLGGGIVYLPPGIYIVDQALTNTKTGVSVRGSGRVSTVLQFTNTLANGFTWSSSSGWFMENFKMVHTSTSTGVGISVTDCTYARVMNVDQYNFFGTAFKAAGASGSLNLIYSTFQATANAADRGVLLGGTSGFAQIVGCSISGGAADAEIANTFTEAVFEACQFTVAGIVKNSSTQASLVVTNCPSMAGFTLASTPLYFAQSNNGIPINAITVATGATSGAPDWSKGWYQKISATSGGAGTVTVPAPTPATAWDDAVLTIEFVNAAGGTVTWSLNSAFRLAGGAAPAGNDGTTTIVTFKYDVAATKWREVSRANSTT